MNVVSRTFTILLVLSSLNVTAEAASPYQSVVIKGVPHVRQKPDFCGEACAEMYLTKLGKQLDQDFVFDSAGLDPVLGRGCYTKELSGSLKRIGFQVGTTWYKVSAANAAKEVEAQFAALHADLKSGVPSIICMHYDDRPKTTEHFRLILGYDAQTDEVIYHEPAVDEGAYRRMKRSMLVKLWPLKYNAQQWSLVRMPLKAGRLTKGSSAKGFTDADYAQHIMRLKKKLPNRKFHIVLQKPFVVIGDESAQAVKRRAEGTVKWSVDRIKDQYFSKDPEHIINIWLFKDKVSYEKHTKQLFGSKPSTPFGYYSPRHKVLVMNISTGSGTLVHEIVHPFMASNFPDCPAWFNEGLASLYEQSGSKQGKIWGYTNWRLRELHGAIQDKKVPSFKKLCSTTTQQFYNEDRGTNYSQARYLCYYLQQKGLLEKYYHEFHRSSDKDPTGYDTLQKVLGEQDMDRFKGEWEKYVSKLRFPE